ncbi:hypothetical protein C8J57DRAFT_1717724 [Mycena rebaudengoi]|nr:hypothetical protein C8J57DRAFT_1717724 [Mycena rebaudengoi]
MVVLRARRKHTFPMSVSSSRLGGLVGLCTSMLLLLNLVIILVARIGFSFNSQSFVSLSTSASGATPKTRAYPISSASSSSITASETIGNLRYPSPFRLHGRRTKDGRTSVDGAFYS